MSQTSFSHISINSLLLLTVLMATKSPQKDLLIYASYVLKQLILVKILGRSTGNHYGTIYQITNILKTAMIYALLLGIKESLFILLRISPKQRQGD